MDGRLGGSKVAVFAAGDREALVAELVDRARRDPRLTGGALTGSASVGATDRWSDIDLAFGVADSASMAEVLADWTRAMHERHGAVHHFDMPVGATVYRVFLLGSTLQVDLAFAPAAEFGPRAATFRLLFGQALETMRPPPAPDAERLVGMAWLYALHTRSCIRRGQVWRAEYMVSAMRTAVLTLACLRCGLETAHARGVDRLPAEVTEPIARSLVGELTAGELCRAFAVLTDALLEEARLSVPEVARRVALTLRALVASAGGAGDDRARP